MAGAREPIGKACACLVDTRGRLLVFDHPADGGMQLPKGTIEPGERPEDAVRRELLEESGIRFDGPLEALGTLDRFCSAGIEYHWIGCTSTTSCARARRRCSASTSMAKSG